ELNPGSAQAHLNLGNALQRVGRSEEAMASFRRTIELQPGSVEPYNNLGNACLASGNRALAIEWYRKALEIEPEFSLAWSNLGVALQQEGRLDEARTAYEKATAEQSLADACNNLGLLLPIYGEVRAAVASFRRAIELQA